jgi:hypothetical protein
LSGAGSILGKDHVGIYGGYYPVKRALDAGVCKYAWQTYAWSGGQWDPRAHIRQNKNGDVLAPKRVPAAKHDSGGYPGLPKTRDARSPCTSLAALTAQQRLDRAITTGVESNNRLVWFRVHVAELGRPVACLRLSRANACAGGGAVFVGVSARRGPRDRD